MKNFSKYIIEKLQINKETGKKGKIQHISKKIDSSADIKIHSLYYAKGGYGAGKSQYHIDKMETYMKKNSDPKRLVNSIKDNIKLFGRWVAAFRLGWGDAIMTFGDALVDRVSNITLENLHQFINSKFNNSYNTEQIEYYKTLYNIEFDD